jgi:hypothetical protein
MTLKEKILRDNYLEDYENPITDYQVDNIIEIADDLAVEFVEWFSANYLKYHDHGMNYTTQELLEIYKKEKGL